LRNPLVYQILPLRFHALDLTTNAAELSLDGKNSYSERWGHWLLDGYMGAWFYTTNPEFFSRNSFFPGTRTQSEEPVGSFEGRLSYSVKPRFWFSLDVNFWFGGTTSSNGVQNPLTVQRNSRIGGTASIPVTKHQSLKLSYSNGDYIRYGGTTKTSL
jgi:hypothetical protein